VAVTTTPDRAVLVTGTTSGIGEAVARRLLELGWRVVGLARRDAPIHHASYSHISTDLGNIESLIRDIESPLGSFLAERRWTRVGLVNNAAHPGLLGPIDQLDVATLPSVLATNLVAPIWLMGRFVRATPPATPLRIVNVSSGAAVRGFAGLGAYGSSKAGLRMAGMVLAAEVEETQSFTGVRPDVSILSFEPGTVDTPMQLNARSSSRETLPSIDLFTRLAAERRLVPPSAPAADVVAFLESDGEPVFVERRLGVR
jgi:NAD(P)-dependent dehydrogenase (short-subunit alcohol dehydrogenase family)